MRVESARNYGLALFKTSYIEFITTKEGNTKPTKFSDLVESAVETKQERKRKEEIAQAVAEAQSAASSSSRGILGLFM